MPEAASGFRLHDPARLATMAALRRKRPSRRASRSRRASSFVLEQLLTNCGPVVLVAAGHAFLQQRCARPEAARRPLRRPTIRRRWKPWLERRLKLTNCGRFSSSGRKWRRRAGARLVMHIDAVRTDSGSGIPQLTKDHGLADRMLCRGRCGSSVVQAAPGAGSRCRSSRWVGIQV